MFIKVKLLILVFAVFCFSTVSAVVVDVTIDANSLRGLDSSEINDQFNDLNDSPASVAIGETVEINVNFLDSQALRIYDDTGRRELFFPWLIGATGLGTFTITNTAISFLGLDGNLGPDLGGLEGATHSSGVSHLGPVCNLCDLVPTGSSIAFTGFRVTFDVLDLPTDPNVYDRFWLIARADRFAVESTNIPEPSSVALLILGLTGFLRVRRRSVIK